MKVWSDIQFKYTCNHNQVYTCCHVTVFFFNLYPIILSDIKPLITIKPSWPSGLRR